MAGIFEQIALMSKSKAYKTLNKYEDPRETLDYSYERQLELLRKVRRGVADVIVSRRRVEFQAQKMNPEIDRYIVTAQRVLESNRKDLAREAPTRETGLTIQLRDLQSQRVAPQAEGEKLVCASTRLQAKADAFRTRKETIKAACSAAEAQTRVNEAFTGISEEMSDVGMVTQRVEDKTPRLQARTSAADELPASGAPEDPMGSVGSDLDRELDALVSRSLVENELAAMKAQLSGGSGTTNPQISPTPTSSLPMIENTRTANNSGGQA